MENGAFHEDGSSGGQRQTSPPWKFATTDDFINVTAKEEAGGSRGAAHSPFFQTVNLLLILPEFLDPEDVQLVSVDVRQETV